MTTTRIYIMAGTETRRYVAALRSEVLPNGDCPSVEEICETNNARLASQGETLVDVETAGGAAAWTFEAKVMA